MTEVQEVKLLVQSHTADRALFTVAHSVWTLPSHGSFLDLHKGSMKIDAQQLSGEENLGY